MARIRRLQKKDLKLKISVKRGWDHKIAKESFAEEEKISGIMARITRLQKNHLKNKISAKRARITRFMLAGEALTGSTLNMDDCWTINIKAPASLLVEKEHAQYSTHIV